MRVFRYLFLSVAAASSAEKLVTVKEIGRVSVKGGNDALSSFIPKGVALNEDEVVVRFRFGNHPERLSTILQEPKGWRSDRLLDGQANSHIKIDESDPTSLFCDLVVLGKPIIPALAKIPILGKKIPMTKDRVVGTAEFISMDLSDTSKSRDTLQAVLKGADGSRNSSIEIDLIQKQWKQMYTNSHVLPGGEIEPFFKVTSDNFVKTIQKTNNLDAWLLSPPSDPANPNLPVISPLKKELPKFNFPLNDEFEPVTPNTIRMFKLFAYLPFWDSLTSYENRDDGIYELRQQLQNVNSKPKEGHWTNPTRDEAMKRIYFSGVGMHLIERNPGFEKGFICDLSDLKKYKMRDDKHPYAPYGCTTYFDDDGNIVKIVDLDGSVYKPGEKYWEWAKLKSRTAAFIKAAFIHLGDVHYVVGNVGGMALRKFMSPKHPFRRALTPHFYKTHHTCRRAEFSLFSEAGLLYRGLSLTYEGGLKQVFIDHIGGYKFKKYTDEIKERKLEGCRFHVGANDGMELCDIFYEYISDFVDELYPSQEEFESDFDMKKSHKYLVEILDIDEFADYTLENVKTIWGEILFRVTGYHNSIGSVTAMALDPSMVDLRLMPKEYGEDDGSQLVAAIESSQSVAFISAITQVPCPTIGQCWKQVLENPGSLSYATLRKNLNDLENTIDDRNKVRESNVDFHPKHCAISISS